eukprot:TRINITY_DN13501_c3_g1_i1.p1 TRINITY_DN13501_c3_g1~~TRINITY_DN13501_c3_g1_i1.p1  ORF type:complete len:248 (-),score=47.68 TRINITY_DN13501_c3_g1_i1:107-850(-)
MMSSSTDPFDVAKDHVERMVQKVRGMGKEWHRLLETENTAESRRFQDLHSEIVGEVQQLAYDLDEIEGSIKAVEENRDRFHLSDEALRERKDFLISSRKAISDVKASLSGQLAKTKMEEDRRRALTNRQHKDQQDQQRRIEQESSAYIEEQKKLQRQLISQQEDELDALSKGTLRLGQVAQTINGELESQQKILDELNQDMDREMERMDVVTKGMASILKTSNRTHIYMVGGAILLFFILIFLILNT